MSLREKITDILNKDIKDEKLLLKPSNEFFNAIDEVHRLQNNRNANGDNGDQRIMSQIYDPKKKEFEMIQSLEKKQKDRNDQANKKVESKEPRILITLQQ